METGFEGASRNKLADDLGTGRRTVDLVLALYRRELMRQQNSAEKITYTDLVNTVRHKVVKGGALSTVLRDINNGWFTLLKHFPSELIFLTLDIPSDSELAFAGACALSADLPAKTIAALLPLEAHPLAVWRWELAGERLHIHILIKSEPLSIAKLKKTWFDILDGVLDEQTLCNPFISENGADRRLADGLVDIKAPYLEDPTKDFNRCYLGLRAKRGKSTVATRKLSILDGARVSPVSHGGLSPALAELAAATSCEIRMGARCREDADYIIDDFKRVLQSTVTSTQHDPSHLEFKPSGPAGQRVRIPRTAFDAVLKSMKQFEVDHTSGQRNNAGRTPAQILKLFDFTILLKLVPNRTLSIYRINRIRRRKTNHKTRQ